MEIWKAIEAVDFHQGIDGLARVCREVLKADPFSGWEGGGTLVQTHIISRVLGNRYLLLHERPAPQTSLGHVVIASESEKG